MPFFMSRYLGTVLITMLAVLAVLTMLTIAAAPKHRESRERGQARDAAVWAVSHVDELSQPWPSQLGS